MRNFVQPGDVVTVPAPGSVTSGQIVQTGALAGIATKAATAQEPLAVCVTGVFDLPKGAEVLSVGDAVEASGGQVTALAAGSAFGVVIADASANDATVRVRLG